MAKAKDGPLPGTQPAPIPAPEAAAQGEGIDETQRPYTPTLLDRLNGFFGRFIGGHARRRGARDTDPGR